MRGGLVSLPDDSGEVFEPILKALNWQPVVCASGPSFESGRGGPSSRGHIRSGPLARLFIVEPEGCQPAPLVTGVPIMGQGTAMSFMRQRSRNFERLPQRGTHGHRAPEDLPQSLDLLRRQWLRFASVRLRTLPSSRKDSRSRIAGGDLWFGRTVCDGTERGIRSRLDSDRRYCKHNLFEDFIEIGFRH